MGLKSIWTKIYQTLASVRTGIFLIIVVGVFSAIGTVILQRPTSKPTDMQRSRSDGHLSCLVVPDPAVSVLHLPDFRIGRQMAKRMEGICKAGSFRHRAFPCRTPADREDSGYGWTGRSFCR
jgi:hypothetical protein